MFSVVLWSIWWRTDAKAEAPILWPPDVKRRFTGKDLDAGKDWGQEKGTTEDEMVGWHHWLDGHEFEQTQGDGEGQGSGACCSSRGRWDTTGRMNNDNKASAPPLSQVQPPFCQSWGLNFGFFHEVIPYHPEKHHFFLPLTFIASTHRRLIFKYHALFCNSFFISFLPIPLTSWI